MNASSMFSLVLFLFLSVAFVVNGETEKVEVTAEPSATSRGALGQGFELHKMDLLTKQLKATGSKIFEDLPLDKCVVSDKLGTIEKSDTWYSDSKSLYKSVSSNTKVEGKLTGAYTLGASVGAVTNNIASSEEQVQGVSLDLKSYGLSSGLKQDCINDLPLSKNLLKDFKNLDMEIKKPWKKTSWRKYEAFIQKYGTHYVKESISGASIYQYVFAKASKSFSQNDFTVKACLSLAGPTQAGKAEISACSEVSKKDIEESKSKSMVKKLVIRGGSAKTRANLNGELSAEQINNFLQEGATDPSPIQYKFKSIANLLKTRFAEEEDFAKALNLDQYYKGFMHFGCNHQVIESAKGNEVEMQKFDHAKESDPETPAYECKVFAEGCHDDEDCHYRHAFWCECGGSHDTSRTCLRYKDTKLPAGGDKREVYPNKVPGWGWHGCKLSGFSCWCSAERKTWDVTWSGEDDDRALRDYHKGVMARKRRDEASKHEDQLEDQ